MSWFQSTNLASFAKTALKEAQKTIDKALDINEEEDGGGTNRTGGGVRSASVVSSAVTDMASDFFSSWGVGGSGNKTPEKSYSNNEEGNNGVNVFGEGTSNSDDTNAISGTISTPPKRCSTMNDLLLTHHENSCSSSLTSDVPVTLLASSGTNEQDGNYEQEKRPNDQGSFSTNKHTRSLSDTVFHSSDDSNNLGDLVQVLDATSSANDTNGVNRISNSQQCDSIRNQEDRNLISLKDNASNLEKALPDHPVLHFDGGSSLQTTNPLLQTETEVAVSNVELLQEIDLDSGVLPGHSSGENVETFSNVISSTDPSNTVETSGLSDGWDWTSTTDSCLVATTEVQGDQSQHTTDIEHTKNDYDNDPAVGTEPISPSKNKESPLEEAGGDPKSEVEPITSSTPPPSSRPEPVPSPSSSLSPKLLPTSSSRAPSPATQDPGGGGGESTPPSSARVSPNFEMVSSGCVVANNVGCVSSTLPESSRSSSIVVVSGRESTMNSRGTSGAGSSGSSEGGHDIVDGEMRVQSPNSPSVSAPLEFPRVTKHKKGASSSSSSDIEVIPSDYSSSSSVPPPIVHHPSKLQNSDIGCQTDFVEDTKDCEIQTEMILDETAAKSSSAKSAEVDPNELSKYVSSEVADLLAEKDAEVQQLREEGEKLSVKQFELSQVIKKLRAKEKENEGVIKGLRTEVATKNLELEKLMKTFISKEGIEQSQNDTISKLNQERRKLELKVEQLSSELEDARDNVESMKATVENASIEILELKNVISSVQRESAEVDRLTRDKAELISRTESLQKEVEHLRSSINTSQASHHSREAELKSQISVLTQKVHHLENQLADISSEVADATMPLSLEIEKLQGELKQQFTQADRREQSMQSTISELEFKLKTASDRERSAKEMQIQYQSQHSTLELRIEELEARNRSLVEQVQQKDEVYGKKIEDKAARCQKLEKTVERLTGEVERLSCENDTLSTELKVERNSLEVERRRISQTFVDTRENNNFPGQGSRSIHPHHQRSSSMSTTGSIVGGQSNQNQGRNQPRNENAREYSPSEHSITSEEASYLDEVFDPTNGMLVGGNANNRSMTPKSFFESFSSAGLIENLQSQLRMREGEVLAFQEELSKNEKIRKQLNEEIANLTMQNQQLSMDMEKLGELEQKLEEVEKNYNAVLQMYGEKVEEADELRMDLDDVKEMYKVQIEQLLKKT